MTEPAWTPDTSQERSTAENWPPVSVHETRSERFVFTENGNEDGWIATNLTVEARR